MIFRNTMAGVIMMLFAVSTLFADTTSINKFLMTVQKDYDIEAQDEKVSAIQNAKAGVPFLDEIEFRMENVAPFSKTLKWGDRMRYSVRLTPEAIGETSAEKRFHLVTLERAVYKKNLIMNKLLKDRYYMIIDFLFKKVELKRYEALSVLYRDRVNVLEKMVDDVEFELEELIDAQKDLTKNEMEVIEIQNLLAVLEKKIRLHLSDSTFTDFDTTDLISVDSLYSLLGKTQINIDSTNIHLMEFMYDVELTKCAYDLERASNRKFLSHIELGYNQDQYHDEVLQRQENIERLAEDKSIKTKHDYAKAFSVGFGITVPFVSIKRDDLVERKTDLIDAKEEYNEMRDLLLDSALTVKGEIQTLVEKFSYIMKRKKEIINQEALSKYVQAEGELLQMLEIEEKILEDQIEMDELLYNIYHKYIKMLNITGRLSLAPIRNYLSKDQGILK